MLSSRVVESSVGSLTVLAAPLSSAGAVAEAVAVGDGVAVGVAIAAAGQPSTSMANISAVARAVRIIVSTVCRPDFARTLPRLLAAARRWCRGTAELDLSPPVPRRGKYLMNSPKRLSQSHRAASLPTGSTSNLYLICPAEPRGMVPWSSPTKGRSGW